PPRRSCRRAHRAPVEGQLGPRRRDRRRRALPAPRGRPWRDRGGPRSRARAGTRARPAAGLDEADVTTQKKSAVLLADDHAVVRLGLRAMIDHQPDLHVVAEAETGTEAIARFLEVQPDIALVDLLL